MANNDNKNAIQESIESQQNPAVFQNGNSSATKKPQRPTPLDSAEPTQNSSKEKDIKKNGSKKNDSEEETTSDNSILNELFPKSAKEKTYNAHSLYLSDAHWKKIQRIAKDQNISCSAVISKIFDKVL